MNDYSNNDKPNPDHQPHNQPSGFQSAPPPIVDNTAGRVPRFLAAMIDGFFAMTVSLPLFDHYGLWELMKTGGAAPMEVSLKMTAYGLMMFFVLHGLLLHRYGQTLGKRLMGIAIVTLDGHKPSFSHLILNRYLPQWVVGFVPILVPALGSFGAIVAVVNVLFVFREDKRCVHDLIAGTKVIDLKIKTAAPQGSLIV